MLGIKLDRRRYLEGPNKHTLQLCTFPLRRIALTHNKRLSKIRHHLSIATVRGRSAISLLAEPTLWIFVYVRIGIVP